MSRDSFSGCHYQIVRCDCPRGQKYFYDTFYRGWRLESRAGTPGSPSDGPTRTATVLKIKIASIGKPLMLTVPAIGGVFSYPIIRHLKAICSCFIFYNNGFNIFVKHFLFCCQKEVFHCILISYKLHITYASC